MVDYLNSLVKTEPWIKEEGKAYEYSEVDLKDFVELTVKELSLVDNVWVFLPKNKVVVLKVPKVIESA